MNLIRKEPRRTVDRHGNVTIDHWSGRRDVEIHVRRPVGGRTEIRSPGEK